MVVVVVVVLVVVVVVVPWSSFHTSTQGHLFEVRFLQALTDGCHGLHQAKYHKEGNRKFLKTGIYIYYIKYILNIYIYHIYVK